VLNKPSKKGYAKPFLFFVDFLKFLLTNKSHRYIIFATVEPQEAEM